MKKILLIGLVTLIFSCKKDKVGNQLEGKWEYRGRVCYCFQVGIDNKQPGNGNIISFSNGTYKQLDKTTVVKSGTYTIVQDQLANQTVNRIIYDNDTRAYKTFFKIQDNKLTLYGVVPTAADGTETYYERL